MKTGINYYENLEAELREKAIKDAIKRVKREVQLQKALADLVLSQNGLSESIAAICKEYNENLKPQKDESINNGG